jgi:TRAP-type C4-dicarboxylate transport system substrate-binding protein
MVIGMILKSARMLAVASVMPIGGAGYASAEVPELKIAVIGAPSNVNAWKQVQKEFFEKTLPEASGGKITVEATPHNEAGIDMVEATRMATDGVINIVNGSFNQVAADDPVFAGIDLPGIGVTVEEARKAAESYRSVVAKRLEEVENLKLLSMQPNTMQVILCTGDISGLDYFRGKKVRVWAKAMGDYMQELGSTPVTIPWEEALPALQSGVADCGITSPSNANNAHWWEVLDSQMVVPLGGWAISFMAANLDWWNGLTPETQALLEEQFKALEEKGWAQGALDLQDGLDCNAGKDTCEYGLKATTGREMETVYPTAADMKLHAQIMQDSVLKNWASDCGAECVVVWNDTVGKTVGITAPTP